MQARPIRTLLYPLCVALLALTSPAMAQAAGKPAAAAQPSAAEVHTLQAQMQKLGMKLSVIERKAIAGSPKLQAQRHKFSAHVIKVMKTLGYDPAGDSRKLAAIKRKVLSGKLKASEREAQIRKFRSIRMNMLQGQVAAMQDKGLQKERQELNKATMLAMKKQDPHAADMIKQFNALAAKLQQMRQASMGHHQ